MSYSKRQSPLRLSRVPGDRLLLGSLALTMGVLSGWGCWLAFFKSARRVGVLETVAQFAIHDAVLAVFILSALVGVWAIAAPAGLDRLLGRRAAAALFAVIIAAPIVVISLWFR